MFGLFKPKCPLDADRKAWTEYRLAWLCRQFGLERMRQTKLLLPSDPRFTSYDGSEDGARKLFDTICKILHVPVGELALDFGDEQEMRGSAGLYDPTPRDTAVQIARPQLGNGQTVVAVMAHELGHHIVMGAGHSPADMPDHEDVTDLFAVFNGFAIFSANSVIRAETKRAGRTSWYEAQRLGYLTAAEFGYALAVRAHVLGESVDDWQKYLRLDASASLNSGLKYINSTGDCIFQRNYDRGTCELSHPELLTELASEFDGNRVAAMWAVDRQRQTSGPVIAAVTDNLDRKSRAVRRAAMQTLKKAGPAAKAAIPALLDALKDSDPTVRTDAVQAVAQIQVDGTTLPHLEKLFCDSDTRVVLEAAQAIARCGSTNARVLKELETVLRNSLVKCDDALTKVLVTLVVKLSPEADEYLRNCFADDEELLQLALDSLAEVKADQSTPAVASSTS